MTTRTHARKNRKKPTKTTPTVTPAPIPTPRPALPLRERRPFITETQIAAAFAASLAGVTYTRITGWLPQTDGTVRYALDTGAALTYNPAAKTPLTAWTPCDHGTRHPHPLTTPDDLHHARTEAANCTSPHTPPDQPPEHPHG
ncbi:hypothetical protein ACFWV1_26150 [Streptomyces sp. NPDC058700]|uniref:hypothetical protein n=1 Tax=Streptomyces sp. NPDC058700 TaxID=3346607 RepID=UPI003668E233